MDSGNVDDQTNKTDENENENEENESSSEIDENSSKYNGNNQNSFDNFLSPTQQDQTKPKKYS